MSRSVVPSFVHRAVRLGGVSLLLVASSLGCGARNESGSQSGAAVDSTTLPAPVQARVDLTPTQGNTVSGTITLNEVPGGIRMVADVTGLTPGLHGIHIHTNGDCSAPDGSSAGDHWNPTAMQHGSPDSTAHHQGDLGNIEAAADGTGHLDRVISGATLQGEHSLVGRSVIVHASVDDMKTQPSGNSGPRQACGVIVLAP